MWNAVMLAIIVGSVVAQWLIDRRHRAWREGMHGRMVEENDRLIRIMDENASYIARESAKLAKAIDRAEGKG